MVCNICHNNPGPEAAARLTSARLKKRGIITGLRVAKTARMGSIFVIRDFI